MRVVQISDTHITHLGGLTTRHLERVIEFVNTCIRPDLVVHTGDLVALDADDEEDRRAVRRLHSVLAAPVRYVPGNHDVGDPGEEPFMGMAVTDARVRAFREAWGADRWVQVLDERWAIVGIDSQLFGSGLEEEAEQWSWLEEAAAALGDRSVLFFSHKPLWLPALERGSAVDPLALSVPDEDRSRILGLFRPGQVEVVGSGHLHRSRTKRRGSVLEVWAPPTAFVPRMKEWMAAPAQLGVVGYELNADGIEQSCWQIPGLPEVEVEDFWAVPGMQAALDRMKARTGDVGSASV